MFRQAGIAAAIAASAVLLGGAPASACEDSASDIGANQWQIGATLGGVPLQFTGAGGLPALLLEAVPSSQIAVADDSGRDVLRLNATRVYSQRSESPALPDNLDLVNRLGAKAPGMKVTDGAVAKVTSAAPQRTATRPQAAAAPHVAAEVTPAQVATKPDFGLSALGGNWVPLQSIGGPLGDSDGMPWLVGFAVLTLGTAAATITVVARRA